jgi:hypothetical protein
MYFRKQLLQQNQLHKFILMLIMTISRWIIKLLLVSIIFNLGLAFWCLTPISTIFQKLSFIDGGTGESHRPDVLLFYFFTIIIVLLPHIFVRSISRRCLDQTLWNLVGISHAMWSCAFKGWFFQNGCCCHGNDQNAKKLKNTKMIIAGYSPNRNWWNLIGTTSTSSGTR